MWKPAHATCVGLYSYVPSYVVLKQIGNELITKLTKLTKAITCIKVALTVKNHNNQVPLFVWSINSTCSCDDSIWYLQFLLEENKALAICQALTAGRLIFNGDCLSICVNTQRFGINGDHNLILPPRSLANMTNMVYLGSRAFLGR